MFCINDTHERIWPEGHTRPVVGCHEGWKRKKLAVVWLCNFRHYTDISLEPDVAVFLYIYQSIKSIINI